MLDLNYGARFVLVDGGPSEAEVIGSEKESVLMVRLLWVALDTDDHWAPEGV